MTPDVSLVVTTYGGETYHTQHCLGWLRRWKEARHEVIVVCHDETPLLRAFLELCRTIGLVDVLVPAVPGHGHVRSVNLGFARARADVVFNVCVDMRIGRDVVTECEARLRGDTRTGAIGWHYDWSPTFDGSLWRDGALRWALRTHDDARVAGELDPVHVENIRHAPWFTGRVFDAIGTRRILCMNGSFFGVRKALWDRLGGFDERRYPAHWADDFFTYATLDQGLDVLNLPAPYRCGGRPDGFQALTDLGWQGRHDPYKGKDRIDWTVAAVVPGLTEKDTVVLEVLARRLDPDATVALVGDPPWRPGRGAVLPASAERPADLVVAGPGAYAPALRDRLGAGGVLVAFDPPAEDGLARVERLGVHRREAPRAAFTRA